MDGDVWVTADGARIPVREMTDRHLHNALAHLRKRLEVADERGWRDDEEFCLDNIDMLERELIRRQEPTKLKGHPRWQTRRK